MSEKWADYKGRLKGKLVDMHRHAQGTGGGPPLRSNLTPLEERARAAIALVEIVGVGDIDTGSSPSRTGEAAPLECEQQAPATPVQEEVARDVEEAQLAPAEYVRQRALTHAAQNLKNATDAQNVHLSQISSTVQHTDQQITSLTNTLSTFMSTHTSLMTTLTTKMDNLNTTVTNIATLLGDILHAHSQRTSGTIPSPSSDYLLASPHTQLSVASNLHVESDSSLPGVSVASTLPGVSVASSLPGVSDSSLPDPQLCRLMCLAFVRGFGQSPVVPTSPSPVVAPSPSPDPAPSPRRTQSVCLPPLPGSSDSSTSRVTRSRSRGASLATPFKKPRKK
ncbi:uncharacterized protein LOC142142772 [Mixophyes fleayi]|uniref:uncharacterized protein LOC142142772 n=1 Tax=Mixophyes fleayi TaxID=3061075 RepID=UPI003F4DF4DD